MSATTVEALSVGKAFHGVAALRDVTLGLSPGEARGLVGENGAGKSTLINILSGALQPDAGTVRIDGEAVSLTSPSAALAQGIGTVHQQNFLVPTLTVLQNVELGREATRRFGFLRAGRSVAIASALEVTGIADLAHRPVSALSLANRQLVAIARALSRGSRLMIFDEPTAALSPVETQRLFAVIERLRSAGVALLYVTHRLEELPIVVDRITVLRAGENVGEVDKDAGERVLVDLMSGTERVEHERAIVSSRRRATERVRADNVIAGRGLTALDAAFVDIDLDVHAGEVLALVGLPDSGAVALTEALTGARALRAGHMTVGGRREITLKSPAHAVRHGVGYLPGDRKVKGVIPNTSVRGTMTLTALRQVSRAGFVRRRDHAALAGRLAKECGVRAARLSMPIPALSGGNQQKALFARAISTAPRVIVCEDPTAGVDPGGREALYELLANACERGGAVVLNSSDLREVALISDRALVLWRGRVVAELDRPELSVEALMSAQFNQHSKQGRRTCDA